MQQFTRQGIGQCAGRVHLQPIQRAGDAVAALVQHMDVARRNNQIAEGESELSDGLCHGETTEKLRRNDEHSVRKAKNSDDDAADGSDQCADLERQAKLHGFELGVEMLARYQTLLRIGDHAHGGFGLFLVETGIAQAAGSFQRVKGCGAHGAHLTALDSRKQ